MLGKVKLITLTFIILLNGCVEKKETVKTNKIIIPKLLLEKEDIPKAPKIHTKIHKKVAYYIIELNSHLIKANQKLDTIKKIIYPKEKK